MLRIIVAIAILTCQMTGLEAKPTDQSTNTSISHKDLKQVFSNLSLSCRCLPGIKTTK